MHQKANYDAKQIKSTNPKTGLFSPIPVPKVDGILFLTDFICSGY